MTGRLDLSVLDEIPEETEELFSRVARKLLQSLRRLRGEGSR